MTLKQFPWVYYMIICHVEPPWGHSGTHGGPKMAENSTEMAQNGSKSPEWLKITRMAQNDPKTLPMVILHDYMSCWTSLDPFQRPEGAP